ncbi:MAG: Fur family transcriptional regulator [Gaiellaceae bacterium]|jgi:Fur family ferric uptake transcriptional regulator
MTTTHRSPALAAAGVEEAVAALRERGLRVSAARRLVLEALYSAEGPLSAERVAEGLEGRLPRSDLASVYRNLETLEEVGLVRHVHLGHGPGLYALAVPEHEYLVCESCHAVRSVAKEELDDIRAQVLDRFGFEARFTHFPLVGLCPDCLAESEGHAHP